MKINEIEKNEWEELLDLYFKEKKIFGDGVIIEDIIACTRRCEGCEKLVLVSDQDDELPTIETWKHEILHCCDECCEEEIDNVEDDYDEYDAYIDYKLMLEER